MINRNELKFIFNQVRLKIGGKNENHIFYYDERDLYLVS